LFELRFRHFRSDIQYALELVQSERGRKDLRALIDIGFHLHISLFRPLTKLDCSLLLKLTEFAQQADVNSELFDFLGVLAVTDGLQFTSPMEAPGAFQPAMARSPMNFQQF
jgi:hypothetical protein